MIFYRNRYELDFQRELSLNVLPRRIDLLVIKKEGNDPIENEMGEIFRKYNLWEVKSPDDALDVSVYLEVMSYAYQYLSEYDTNADLNDISITFLRESVPEDLMGYLAEKGFREEKKTEGLYRYRKHGHPDMQIVIISKPGVSPWYRVMAHNAEKGDMSEAEALFMELPEELRRRTRTIWELTKSVNKDKDWAKEGSSMVSLDLFKQLDEKDKVIEEQKKQLEQDREQLEQNREQLRQKDKEIAVLRQKLEALA